jgi:AcrR family transcriptional regulator
MARTSDPVLAERRRRQIIDAALACFRRRGFHQASMQEICAQAQISAGALYHYFPSKAHLIGAIAEDVQSGLEAIFAGVEHSGDLIGALEAMARVMFEDVFVPGDGALVADVMAEAARDRDLAVRLQQIHGQMHARLASLIVISQSEGRLCAQIDADQAATTVLALVDGLGIKQSIDGAGAAADSCAAFNAFVRRYFASAPTPAPMRPRRAARIVMKDITS